MGQGIKGIIGIKGKIAIVIALLLFAFSIFFLINPRYTSVYGNISGSGDYQKLEKSKEANHYYISFLLQQGDKMTKLECTKKQYDFISDKQAIYHIFYRLDFFNKKVGEILDVDIQSYMS